MNPTGFPKKQFGTGETDVDAAYLNTTLKEDIYMQQHKCLEVSSQEDKVIHLK